MPPEASSDIENPVNQESKFTDEIMAQEKKWASALVASDMKTVDSIMHRDFRLKRVYGDALPISKEMYLGMPGMSAEKMDVTHFEILEELGAIVVAKTAMSMDWQQEGVGKLPPYSVSIDIWQRNENGSWQVLSRVSQILDEPYSGN
ncbi:MAG: nuclear transport factor 2 family protein [Bacteroidota bacterium]